jgi:isopenicillin N synthase-like dioxygenase
MNAHSGRERFSMAYFHGPSYDTQIACIPTCLEPEEQPKYPPMSIGEYTAQRLARR